MCLERIQCSRSSSPLDGPSMARPAHRPPRDLARGDGRLALASAVLWQRVVGETCAFGRIHNRWVRVKTFGHFVANDVNQTLEHTLYVNIFFGGCFEKLEA